MWEKQMGNLIDTLLNIGVFIFIGLMLWLLFKKDKKKD